MTGRRRILAGRPPWLAFGRSARARAPRLLFFSLVAVLSLALSGCVYLRLLQLKRQLADFDRHFTLHTTEGVRLECLDPVLLADDVRWLGFAPATIAKAATTEDWHIRWLKQNAPDDDTPGNFEIAFDLSFANEKLSALAIPERYFSLLPKDVVVSAIKSLGGANVDKSDRQIASRVRLALGDQAPWPTQATIFSILGPPTREQRDDEQVSWHYHFVSADPERRGEAIDLRLTFSPDSQNLTHLDARLPVGRVSLNFTAP